ncbi:metal-dependent hydrolase [Candidatus Woesearchaeota archaeon]|jgi:membrane-bound metal-dependent hydrolase YbcI (DUF457 family)|nr:metal-dependent hydrolase [Candidatus Woesearchaeota archaeon]MBT4322265.1 metal-dependent hydrolase [Candidatus Woesearchaeota archaeon]
MFPFEHLVVIWIVASIIQKVSKIKISRLGWALLFFGALLPDVDYLFVWISNSPIHRTFTHSFVFVILGFFVSYFILKQYKLEKESIFFSIGIFSHVILDMFIFPGLMLFWPIGTLFSFYGLTNLFVMPVVTIGTLHLYVKWLLFDIVLGVVWLSYLYFKGKINF